MVSLEGGLGIEILDGFPQLYTSELSNITVCELVRHIMIPMGLMQRTVSMLHAEQRIWICRWRSANMKLLKKVNSK